MSIPIVHKNVYIADNTTNTKEGIMNDCYMIAFGLGIIAGALMVSKNEKAQELVEKGKKAVKKQIEKMK